MGQQLQAQLAFMLYVVRSTDFNNVAASFQIDEPSLQNTSGLASTPLLSTHYKTLKARHTLHNHHSHHHHHLHLELLPSILFHFPFPLPSP